MSPEERKRYRDYAEQIIAHMDEGGNISKGNCYDLARMILNLIDPPNSPER